MCTEIRGLPSSNDLINPFYVLSWRRLRRAGNASGGCGDLGPAACLPVCVCLVVCLFLLPCESYSNSNSGRGTEPSFIDCAISCTNDPFSQRRQKKPKATPYSNSQPQLEIKLKTEPHWDTRTHKHKHIDSGVDIVNMLNGFSNI